MELLFMVLESLSYAYSDVVSNNDKVKLNRIIFNEEDTENKSFVLKVILLAHIAYHDDQYISEFEKKKIMSFVNEFKPLFSKHLNTIKIVLKKEVWSKQNIKDYVQYNKIDLLEVKEVLKQFKIKVFAEEKYNMVFDDLYRFLNIKEYSLRRMLSI